MRAAVRADISASPVRLILARPHLIKNVKTKDA